MRMLASKGIIKSWLFIFSIIPFVIMILSFANQFTKALFSSWNLALLLHVQKCLCCLDHVVVILIFIGINVCLWSWLVIGFMDFMSIFSRRFHIQFQVRFELFQWFIFQIPILVSLCSFNVVCCLFHFPMWHFIFILFLVDIALCMFCHHFLFFPCNFCFCFVALLDRHFIWCIDWGCL